MLSVASHPKSDRHNLAPTSSPRPGEPWTAWAIIVLTVLAPVMGGSTTLWARAALTVCIGLLFLLFPPQKSLGLYPNLALAGLFALALAAFLPAQWLPLPIWRSELVKLGAQLPPTITAQPWLTLESAFVLLLGVSWTYYLLAFDWNWDARQKTWVSLAAAIVALAAALTASFLLKKRIPFWPDAPEFGFFPNRNHTSNVLGLGGILVYALALRGFDEGRRNWWIWLAALSLISSALILNYSRAGIILLCGGVLAWHLYWLTTSEHKQRPLIASGVIILLLALFAWNGGKTAVRFGRETAEFFSLSQNMRFAIYRDAFDLSLKSPFTGIGLKNFAAVFTTNQHFSLGPNIAVHPESDWIWSAVEMGWFAPLLIVLLFCWWTARCLPFERGTFRLLRLAAFICGCGFVLHGLFDVPGHRIGALWPALLIASTALHPKFVFDHSRAIPILFRVLGPVLIAVGTWWSVSLVRADLLPTTETLNRSLEEIESAGERSDYQTMLTHASQALKIAPLNWELYFKRGFAEAALYRPRAETVRDFSIARYLLPNWADLYAKEGQVWLALGEPDLGFDLWKEGIDRLGDQAPSLYEQISAAVKPDAELRERWRDLGHANKKCVMIFLRNASPTEFELEVNRLVFEDPELKSFTPAELKGVFQLWYDYGDQLALAEILRQHPEWQKIAWHELARVYANHQDYRQAYETVARFSPPPPLPKIDPSESIDSLAKRFRISRDNANDGLRVALAQLKAGDLDDALAMLKALSVMQGAPHSLSYVESEIWARKGEWQKAWQALSQFTSN